MNRIGSIKKGREYYGGNCTLKSVRMHDRLAIQGSIVGESKYKYKYKYITQKFKQNKEEEY